MRIHTKILVLLALAFAIKSCNGPTQTSQYDETPTALKGIYTQNQVDAVGSIYANDCASCHGGDLRGTEGGSSLIGTRFQNKWKEKTMGELFEYTRTTMPVSNPGGYDDETYASLLAYILNFNRYPAGETPLSSNKDELDKVIFGPPSPIKVANKYTPNNPDQKVNTIEADWPQHRADQASTNYSPLDQINSSNVAKLNIAWRWKSDNFGPRPEYYYKTTPLMVKGILYATAGIRRAVVALDAITGETLWTYSINEGERTVYNPRQNSGRGVAYWEAPDGGKDRILYITPGYQLIALDAATGQIVDGFGENGIVDLKKGLGEHVDPITTPIGSTSPPIIVNDIVVVGSCFPPGLSPPSKNQVQGDIMAYDVRNGKQLWIFHTIPQEGEFGNETWENNSWKYTGNVAAWTPLSADSELGYVYIPLEAATGDFYGGHRPGDNLFSQSLVCLNVKTGERVWHYQLVHHDIWDYDLPAPPVLADINVDGQEIKAVIQVTKQAFVFVFDRITGKPVWPIEERKVPPSDVPGEFTAPTQPFPTKPLPFDRQEYSEDILSDFTPEIRKEALRIAANYRKGSIYTPIGVVNPPDELATLMLPSPVGGANWQGAVLDPETNILYVSSTTVLRPVGLQSEPDISDMNYVAWAGNGLEGPFGLPLAKPPWGRITAINLNTGEHEWMIPNTDTPDWAKNHPKLKDLDLPRTGSPDRVGLLVTKSLLFAGEGAGIYSADGGGGNKFRAHDKATGEIIAEIELPANQAGVPMTYSINGKQYIVIAISGRGHPGELVALTLQD